MLSQLSVIAQQNLSLATAAGKQIHMHHPLRNTGPASKLTASLVMPQYPMSATAKNSAMETGDRDRLILVHPGKHHQMQQSHLEFQQNLMM